MSTKAKIEAFNRMNGTKANSIKDLIKEVIKIETTVTKDDLINLLRIKHQTITARLSELFDEGIVSIAGERDKCSIYFLSDPSTIEGLKKKRHFKKYQEYLNRGKKQFDLPDEVVVQLCKIYKEKHNI